MSVTLAFDVYGTLIDTAGVVSTLHNLVGAEADEFSRIWREKQLEYAFRRGLMQNYENFSVCTRNALDYTCIYFNVALTDEQKNELLDIYRVLPAFEDVEQGLTLLRSNNYRLYAFSNGSEDVVRALLHSAGILKLFLGIISTDELKSFKPNPAVYSHFLRQSGALGKDAWLVSSNSFDVIGAISAGMRGVWVRRSKEAIFDPWEIKPTLTVNSLSDLCEQFSEHNKEEVIRR